MTISVKDSPIVTLEQIVRFRSEAMKIEKQRDSLLELLKLSMKLHGSAWLDGVKEERESLFTTVQAPKWDDIKIRKAEAARYFKDITVNPN